MQIDDDTTVRDLFHLFNGTAIVYLKGGVYLNALSLTVASSVPAAFHHAAKALSQYPPAHIHHAVPRPCTAEKPHPGPPQLALWRVTEKNSRGIASFNFQCEAIAQHSPDRTRAQRVSENTKTKAKKFLLHEVYEYMKRHGTISRDEIEQLVEEEKDFIIRTKANFKSSQNGEPSGEYGDYEDFYDCIGFW
ncbi:hypothetical protein G6011_01584 [Alternaria panax]|uniref:Uncharacterized protein n=1 Tax=Alternaria panax TaxID=48097 RepID=A0AAD4NVY7_9PLEO|nr:hypothetical protein G6011_01584 [Alternaria panax]